MTWEEASLEVAAGGFGRRSRQEEQSLCGKTFEKEKRGCSSCCPGVERTAGLVRVKGGSS